MRSAAAKAWPGYCEKWEGRLSWMYLDTKFKVTTGTGNLIDTVGAATALPWYTKTGRRASTAEVTAEWWRVKKLTSLASRSGWAYQASAQLFLHADTLDRLLYGKTAEFWARLGQTVTKLDEAPADAQLALMDLSWQNGPGFLDLIRDGKLVWPNMRRACLAADWAAAANAVPDPHPDPGDDDQKDRAEFRKRLLRNAAIVQRNGMNRDVLWDHTQPVPPSPEGFDMTVAKEIYKRGTIDQPIPANTDVTLCIDDAKPSRNVSPVVGENPGVQAKAVITFDADTAGQVKIWPVLVDWSKTDSKDIRNRVSGWVPFPAGKGLEGKAEFLGSLPKSSGAGRSARLRFRIRATVPIVVTNIEITGWEMP